MKSKMISFHLPSTLMRAVIDLLGECAERRCAQPGGALLWFSYKSIATKRITTGMFCCLLLQHPDSSIEVDLQPSMSQRSHEAASAGNSSAVHVKVILMLVTTAGLCFTASTVPVWLKCSYQSNFPPYPTQKEQSSLKILGSAPEWPDKKGA